MLSFFLDKKEDWKKNSDQMHRLTERLASFGIMGALLMAPMKLMGSSQDYRIEGHLEFGPHYPQKRLPL